MVLILILYHINDISAISLSVVDLAVDDAADLLVNLVGHPLAFFLERDEGER